MTQLTIPFDVESAPVPVGAPPADDSHAAHFERVRGKGIGGHQRGYRGRTDTWLTPPRILEALGAFDLDPCCPPNMPWRTAERMLTPADDGLAAEWLGRVYLCPPYGPETGKWLKRLARHKNGVALVFARTETKMWFDAVWGKASAILFIQGRLHFHHADGTRAKANAGGPTTLIAYDGDESWGANAAALIDSGIPGALVPLKGWAGAGLKICRESRPAEEA